MPRIPRKASEIDIIWERFISSRKVLPTRNRVLGRKVWGPIFYGTHMKTITSVSARSCSFQSLLLGRSVRRAASRPAEKVLPILREGPLSK